MIAAPVRADDDFVRRRLRGRHAADGFDDRFRDLLSHRGVAAGLGEPGDPTNDDDLYGIAEVCSCVCATSSLSSLGTARTHCSRRAAVSGAANFANECVVIVNAACMLDERHPALYCLLYGCKCRLQLSTANLMLCFLVSYMPLALLQALKRRRPSRVIGP